MKTYLLNEKRLHTRALLDDAMVEIAQDNGDFVFVAPDMGRSLAPNFVKQFPSRHINTGIAEQSCIGIAAGLALEGRQPLVYGIAPFVSMRACEQIRTDVCYQGAPVVIIASYAGLCGGNGSTHYGMEDTAIMRAFPGMTVIDTGDPEQTALAFKAALSQRQPAYLRMGTGRNEPCVYAEPCGFQIGKAIMIQNGKDITLIASGLSVAYAVEAARRLASYGIDAGVMDMHTIKPLDNAAVLHACAGGRPIVTVENHNVIGGLGSAVAEVLAEAGSPCRFKRLGIRDRFPGFGSFMELQDIEGYGITAMVETARDILGNDHSLDT